ncbi:MAG: hypothetical protein AAGA90_04165 [Actinomycetota bacterium]
MSEFDTDDLRRRAESGVPRGAASVWSAATGEVRRRRRRARVGAGLSAAAAAVFALSFVVGGDDGADTEVVSPPTTQAGSGGDAATASPDGTTDDVDVDRAGPSADGLVDVLLLPLPEAEERLASVGHATEVVVGSSSPGAVVLASDPPPGRGAAAGQTVRLVVGSVPIPWRETPMRAMLDDLFLWTWDGAAGQRIALRTSELVAACMTEQGQPYEVWVQPVPEQEIGVVELARNGWGLARRLVDGPEPQPSWMEPNPNLAYAASLSGAAFETYNEIEGACHRRATEEIDAWQSPFNLEQQDLLAEVAAELGASFAAIDSDPALIEGRRRYFECLRAAHGVEIEEFFHEHLIVTERLDEFVARHGDDPSSWSQDAWDEFVALEHFEHEVAFTVVACVTEHVDPVRDEVATRVEEAMIEEYADFLAGLQDVVDRALG